MTTTPNARVILPAEAVGKAPQVQAMLECWHRMKCWMGQLDAGRKMPAEKYGYIHRKMEIEADQLRLHLLHPEISAASPNAGRVTEAELSTAYAAAKEACEGCTSNFCGDCDCDGFTCKEGIRAALSALGLDVEG